MTTETAAFSHPFRSGKAIHISLWVVQGLLVAAFGMAGAIKLITPYAELATQMPWVSAVPAFVPKLAGFAEIAGALGLFFPAILRIKPALTPLAAAGLVLVMASAATLHLSRGELDMLPVTLILGGLAAFVAWGRLKVSPIAPK